MFTSLRLNMLLVSFAAHAGGHSQYFCSAAISEAIWHLQHSMFISTICALPWHNPINSSQQSGHLPEVFEDGTTEITINHHRPDPQKPEDPCSHELRSALYQCAVCFVRLLGVTNCLLCTYTPDQHRQLFECRRTYGTPRECSTKQNQLIRGLYFTVLRILVAVKCKGGVESIEEVPTMRTEDSTRARIQSHDKINLAAHGMRMLR